MIKSERDKCLLIGLIGVLFAVIAWFLIASPIKSKTEEIKTTNVALKEKADLYVEISAGLDEYEKQIAGLTEEKETILNKFPSNISREDQIMFWANMENIYKDDLAISTLSMGEFAELLPELAVAEAAPVADETTEDAATTEETTEVAAEPTAEETAQQEAEAAGNAYHLYYAPMNFSFLSTYTGLKAMINHLYTQNEKMNITALSVAFDSSTGNLAGTVDMSQFYMLGTDKPYAPAQIPAVQKGVSDVFHTVEGAGLTPLETETETDTDTEE